MLNEAVETHFKLVRGLSFGADYLTVMNPDYVTTLVKVIRHEINFFLTNFEILRFITSHSIVVVYSFPFF